MASFGKLNFIHIYARYDCPIFQMVTSYAAICRCKAKDKLNIAHGARLASLCAQQSNGDQAVPPSASTPSTGQPSASAAFPGLSDMLSCYIFAGVGDHRGIAAGAYPPRRRIAEGRSVLDGSPPAYQLQRGFGSGSYNWLVYLEGGGWCSTIDDCSKRKKSGLGSSNLINAVQLAGIFSSDRRQNSDFYNWNIVFVRYCDGASFSGDGEVEDQDGTKLFFRGLRIWEAVIDDLMEKGLSNAKQALLAGCSSGGLATLLHCDDFSARFPRTVPVKCFSDAGFFLDKKDIFGDRFIRSIYNGVVHLQNVSKVLPSDCLAMKEPVDCFFPSEIIKSINTPTFILNSGYDSWQIRNVLVPDERFPEKSWLSCKADIRKCDSIQIEALHGFRKTLIEDLKVVEGKEDWGFFIDSCFTHCQTPFRISWDSPISPRLGNKTIAEAFGDWYFGRSQEVKQIDCKYPCNPTCSTLLPA